MGRTAFHVVLLVVVAVVVSGASVGTAGFSAAEADRTVSVSVVPNDEASVGVVACEKSNDRSNGSAGSDAVRVWVENRYTEQLSVTSVTSDDAARTDGSDGEVTVGAGESRRFEVVFADDVTTLTVDVSADGLDASVTRDVVGKSSCPRSVGDGDGSGRS